MSECPDGLDRIGALCYDPCPVGYDRFGFDCHQKCPTDGGWRDDGLFCRRAEKGRGIGYPWKFGDSLNDLGMFQRCENDYGDGNCETWGLVVYPKCSLSQVGGDGYYPFGCCICRPNVPDCDELGYNGGLDLSCAKKIQIGNPRPLKCSDSQEQDGLLCYPQCDQGFGGVGPVCWQYCDTDRFDCGAACAKDGGQCAIAVVDMVLAPIIMAASLATFGLASLPAKTANSVKIGGKFYKATKNAKRIKKVFDYSKKLKKVNTAAKVYKKGVVPGIATFEKYTNADGEILIAQMIFGTEPFAERTTKVIDDKLKEELSAWNYLKVINTWEEKQFVEIAEAEGWFAAKIGLTLVGLADPFGIVDTVNAYAHPTCAAVIPFPTGLPPKN